MSILAISAFVVSLLSLAFTSLTHLNSKKDAYRQTLLTFLERQENKCFEYCTELTADVLSVPDRDWDVIASVFERCDERLRYVREALVFLVKHGWTMGPAEGQDKDIRLNAALRKNSQFCEYIQELYTVGAIYDDDGKPFLTDLDGEEARDIISKCEFSFSTCFHLLRYEIINTGAPFSFGVKRNKAFQEFDD